MSLEFITFVTFFLNQRQAAEMKKVMHELGNTLCDQDVNTVAAQHFKARQVRRTPWPLRSLKKIPEFNFISLCLIRCWRANGPVSWSRSPASRSRSTRSGWSSCTRTSRSPTTAAKSSEIFPLYFFFLFAESRVLSLFAYFPLDICNLPLHTHVHLNRQFCDSLTGAKEIVDSA